MTYKVHLDGYNLVPYLTGQAEKSPRESFLYCNDDQQLTGLRYDNWKLVFMEQRARGTLRDLGGAVHDAPRAEDLQPPDWTRTSGRTSPRTPTTTGCSITPSCWSRRRTTSASS